MGCKLTRSLPDNACSYAVAGARKLYFANWYPAQEAAEPGAAPVEGAIQYHTTADGEIDAIILPTGESFYEIDGSAGSLSFTDALTVGGNGGKYRTQTVNAVLPRLDADMQAEADALSLGRFMVAAVDAAGRISVLGRTGGLTASQMDYGTGAAEGDASGWTAVWAGTSTEVAPLVTNLSVITPISKETVTE